MTSIPPPRGRGRGGFRGAGRRGGRGGGGGPSSGPPSPAMRRPLGRGGAGAGMAPPPPPGGAFRQVGAFPPPPPAAGSSGITAGTPPPPPPSAMGGGGGGGVYHPPPPPQQQVPPPANHQPPPPVAGRHPPSPSFSAHTPGAGGYNAPPPPPNAAAGSSAPPPPSGAGGGGGGVESPPVPVEERVWFQPKLSVEDTAKWLRARSAGAFVVRPSSQGANCLALSYLTRSSALEHALIYRSGSRGFCLEHETGVWHVTLDGLLRSLALDPQGSGEGGDMLDKAVPAPPPSHAAQAAAANLAARVQAASPTATVDGSSGSGGGGGGGGGEAQSVVQEMQSGAAPRVKKAVFQLRDKLLDAQFAEQFLAHGGLTELRALIAREHAGNTLAYALEALRRLWRFQSPTEAEPGGVLDLDTLLAIVARLDEAVSSTGGTNEGGGGGGAGALNVVKSSLELVMLLNQRDKTLAARAFGGTQQGAGAPARFSTLVQLLGWQRADVDVQRKALTLLNAVLQNERDEGRRAELYDELDQRGLFPALAPLRGARDPMLCTHLCAFQVQRFAGLARRKHTAFDKQNPEHEAQLARLWQWTFPDRPMERISSEWGLLGFQGKDPATDFRGMGMLGLDCLCYFAEHYTDRWRALIQRNIARGEREYPVAVGGINVCSAIDEFFNFSGDSHASPGAAIAAANAAMAAASESASDGTDESGGVVNSAMLHPLLLDHRHPFEEIHCWVLEMLDKLWDAMNASYMQFQSVLGATREQMLACMNGRYPSFDEWRDALARNDPLPLPVGGDSSAGNVAAASTGSGGRKQKLQHLIKSARRSASDMLSSHGVGSGGSHIGAGSPLSSSGRHFAENSSPPHTHTAHGPVSSSPPSTSPQQQHQQQKPHSPAPRDDGLPVPRLEQIPMDEMKLSSVALHESDLTSVHAARRNGVDDVCVKQFAASDAGRAEWLAEAGALTKVSHPHVVQLLGVMVGTRPALVLALAEGGNLADSLVETPGDEIDIVQRVHLAIGVARGLAALHSQSVVHGALAARHILVDAGTWRPRICSLGARQTQVSSKGSPNLSAAGPGALSAWAADVQFYVDPAYTAPELFAKSAPATPAADAFSLAVLVWAIALWRVPWEGQDACSIINTVFGKGQRLPLDDAGFGQPADALGSCAPALRKMFSPAPANRTTAQDLIRTHLLQINDGLY